MPEQSSMHSYLSWTKQRIDEMDATLASLEAKAGQVKAESQAKADQLIADMKKRRDEFQVLAERQAEAGEAALQRTKGQLETQWNGFEAQLKNYFETAAKHLEQQQATFQDVAAAQMKAWREAAGRFHDEAAKAGAAKRADMVAAIERMKGDAAETEARLRQAGKESWTALSAALAESRKAFDQANQEAWNALKNVTSKS